MYKATSSYDPGSGGYTLTGEEVTFWSPAGQRMGTYTLLVDPGGNGYGPTLSFRWTNSERVYFGNRLMWRGGSAVYTDRLGSVGKYFPYGEERPSATGGDGERFATYYRDGATGLDYAVNRYYDPGTGRFVTADPYVNNTGALDPTSWNRYSYTRGNPVTRFDPSGLDDCVPSPGSDFCVVGTATAPKPSWTPPQIVETVYLGLNGIPAFSTFSISLPPINVDSLVPGQADARRNEDAAIEAAIQALRNNETCRRLFGDSTSRSGQFDPEAVLRTVFSGTSNPLAGVGIRGGQVAGTLVTSNLAFGWMMDLGGADATTVPFPLLGIHVDLNTNSFLNSGTGYLAGVLLHELGHVYNLLASKGSGGSQILDDAGNNEQSGRNFLKVLTECNLHP